MPPKLSDSSIDGTLDVLREYVRDHCGQLAPRGGACLKCMFAARRNAEEKRFYQFLHRTEARFTEAQRRHVRGTLALLAQHRGSDGGAESHEGRQVAESKMLYHGGTPAKRRGALFAFRPGRPPSGGG